MTGIALEGTVVTLVCVSVSLGLGWAVGLAIPGVTQEDNTSIQSTVIMKVNGLVFTGGNNSFYK